MTRVWLLALLLGFCSVTPALAADNTLYSLTNNSPFTIYDVNTTSGAATSAGTLAFASASLARHPASGLLYYTEITPSAGAYRVATWNPSTLSNTILSGTVNVYLPRLAFRADGTLFAMDSNNNLYTLSTTTGAILTTSGPVTGGGLPTGLGGDMAFAPDSTLYIVAGSNLYRISGTSSILVGATGTASLAGLAFATDGALYASDTGGAGSLIYKLSTTNGAGTLVGNSGAALSDLAGMPKFADISIAKSASGGFAVGQNAAYTLTVSNAGPQSTSGPITVSDTLPSGLTYVSASGTGWTCSAAGSAVTCTNAGPLANGASSPITLTVAVGVSAAPNVTNTATVSSTTFDPTPGNNSSTVTKAVVYIRLTKSVSPGGTQPPGTDLNYTVTFDNLGGVPASSFIITDLVPLNTQFKVGSMSYAPGTSGFSTPAYSYFSDAVGSPPPAPPWSPMQSYTPSGAAGTYDSSVTYVRWTFTGSLPVNTSGNVSFTVRIR